MEQPMRFKFAAIGRVASLGFASFSSAAWIPPAGYTRISGDIDGSFPAGADAVAVAPDGKVALGYNKVGATPGSVKVFADYAAASLGTSPIQTFTNPSFNSFGDLTFN